MNLLPKECTVLDCLVEAVRKRGVAHDGEAAPAAILWPDPGREWLPILELVRERLPELLALDAYDADQRSGPAIWLRCVVDGVIEIRENGDPALPILYLPGVSRGELAAGDECPDALRPLVELLHRGTVFRHQNGRDWTVAAFFGAGAGLDLAEGQETAKALRGALAEAVVTPLSSLSGRRLGADDFHRLLVGDLPRDLLRWLGDPEGVRGQLGGNWDAFRDRCRHELDFDPEKDGAEAAGKRIGVANKPWDGIWDRFAENPAVFPGVEDLLRRCQPSGGLFQGGPSHWPGENDRREEELREALAGITALSHSEACDRVKKLEDEHGVRRDWVWARLEQSPLAMVLDPLSQLARGVGASLGGANPENIAAAYRDGGWRTDAAAWKAQAAAPVEHEALVAGVVRHLLEPWLDASARAFQDAARRTSLPAAATPVEPDEDGCLFFVDALRYDLGRRLAERLEERGFRAEVRTRWAVLPSVTATAKPAVTPLASEIEGGTLGEDFAPRFAGNGKSAGAKAIRGALEERGYQILGEEVAGPGSAAARGFLETGEIDKLGHSDPERFAGRISGELDRLAERIAGLLAAGWRSVRVVTDHGWLLLPGGLPRVDLPKHLTETRWARCAVLSGNAASDADRWRWHWNAAEWFASPPGIACFNKSDAFAHGGVSIQEFLTPDIMVERSETEAAPSIESVTWRRLRCFVTVSGGERLTADLRLGGSAGESVAKAPKAVDAEGVASLVLAGDEHEAAALSVVVLDAGGTVVAARDTRVGANS